MTVQSTSLPTTSTLFERTHHYADSYAANLSYQPDLTAVARAFFSTAPSWVTKLFALRNRLVKHLGLKTSNPPKDHEEMLRNFQGQEGEQIGFFKVFERSTHELIMGEDDKHLDFRVSILLTPGTTGTTLTISTTVIFHNALGKWYFVPVKPFHQVIVRAMLRKMVRHLEENK
ncbi:DUF2867 domain-containing protein [Marinoscillum furvescens]|uniref:Uncharacterized protein DUF2867 n=1 Tax=Marinoscillum furvescens DSM 4134 TaxID=1122208 RepID=A0A3D9KVK3_MARFU|nr:DUF2867 domain-containing protein [Marinoscillum furvescens]RED91501.1 uncharacterized protein DUF2867 [Marinoscillum furvescens DSM 4134]